MIAINPLRATPHWTRIMAHPLFVLEERRTRRARQMAQVKRYSLITFGIVIAAALILRSMVIGFWPDPSNYTYSAWELSNQVLTWIVMISLGTTLLMDFAAVLGSVGRIMKEQTTRNWDLLQMSSVAQHDIVHVKHALAQITAWRAGAFVVALRLAVAIMFLMNLFMVQPWDDEMYILEIISRLLRDPLEQVPLIVIVLTLITAYLLEPFWRMRTVTALGLAISARFQQYTVAAALGLASMIAFIIGQILLLVFMGWATNRLFSMMFSVYDSVEDFFGLIFAVYVLICIGIFYMYYLLLARAGLRWAERRAFRT